MKTNSLVGVVLVVLGTVFLDLSTLALKNDLYLLTLLGFFNNHFSLSLGLALFQSVVSVALIYIGVKIIKWQR